ncbi:MAG: hypothetical protein LV471_09130 [Nitrosomonas sp.]|nr:hypothetical protein [Nitrosomonas sp.]
MLGDLKMVIVIACIFFVCGFGWGQWFAERAIRKERSNLEQGRLLVSVPMHKDEASRVFEAIQTLVELSEGRRDE